MEIYCPGAPLHFSIYSLHFQQKQEFAMGRPLNLSGTQAKERARQQKQAGKELKRMITRQKKTYAKTPAPNVHSDTAEPGLAEEIFESKNIPIHSSMER